MPNLNSTYGKPADIPWISNQTDFATPDDIGGTVVTATAASTLKYGDLVFRLPGGRVDKSLESSVYPAYFVGVVVGGTTTDQQATNDITCIGDNMSAVGEKVLVQTSGLAYAAADVTNQVRLGDDIVAGTTTAGRALGGSTASFANTIAGMAIKAGGNVLAKSVNAFVGVCSGLPSTATAANLDGAALVGTVNNATFNVFVFRVATNGTTVTTAMGTAGASLAAVLWPTAGASNLITYAFVVINPTGTGNFVGGTTPLDDATVVPNAKYYNLVGQYRRLGLAVSTPAAGAGAAFVMHIRG